MGRSKAVRVLVGSYVKKHPEGVAKILQETSFREVSRLLSGEPVDFVPALMLVSPAFLSETFRLMPLENLVTLIPLLPETLTTAVFRGWKSAEDQEKLERFFAMSSDEQEQRYRFLLNTSEGLVESLMSPVTAVFSADISVFECLKAVRKSKSFYSPYVYFQDAQGSLAGVASMKDLFYAKSRTLVRTVMNSSVFVLNQGLPLKKAIRSECWRQWDRVPIVTSENKVLGVLKRKALFGSITLSSDPELDQTLLEASVALGELFQIGANAAAMVVGLNTKDSKVGNGD